VSDKAFNQNLSNTPQKVQPVGEYFQALVSDVEKYSLFETVH